MYFLYETTQFRVTFYVTHHFIKEQKAGYSVYEKFLPVKHSVEKLI